jgi:hypothetical protein
MKKLFKAAGLLALLAILALPLPVLAASPTQGVGAAPPAAGSTLGDGDVGVQSLPVIYFVSSKTYVKFLPKVLKKDWTPSWSYASKYVLTAGWSYTSTLGVDATVEVTNAVKASASFVQSRTYTCNVSVEIPADRTRLSKLAHFRDYRQYDALIKYYAGTNPIALTYGTVVVKEPTTDSYNLVRYQ